jgi:peptidyl-prolyl cis-trans isomerase SurA
MTRNANRLLCTVLLLSGLPLSAAPKSKPVAQKPPAVAVNDPAFLDGVAATVNTDVVTFSQVRELTGPVENSARSQFSGAALAEKIKEVRLNAVNMLIDRQLILQEFRKMKGQIPGHMVDERISETIRTRFGGDRAAFLRTISAQGLTQDKLRKMEEENIIVKYMRGKEVKTDTLVSTSEVEKFYREHRDEWTTNTEVKLRMIKINPGADPAKKRKLVEEIRAKVLAGKDFADLARIYSEDSTQDQGGDWGWVKKGDLSGELDRQVFLLQTKKVSPVLNMNGAFYLLLAEDKKSGTAKPLKEVREEIEQRITQAARQKQEQVWMAKLRKKAFIKIY